MNLISMTKSNQDVNKNNTVYFSPIYPHKLNLIHISISCMSILEKLKQKNADQCYFKIIF